MITKVKYHDAWTHLKMVASNAAVCLVTPERHRSMAVSPFAFCSFIGTEKGSSNNLFTTACAWEDTAKSKGVSAGASEEVQK